MIHSIEHAITFTLQGLWRASWQASVLVLVVLVAQHLLGKRLGGRGRYALWAIVLIRLLIPVLPESRVSIFNLPARLAARDQKKTEPVKVERAVAAELLPVFVIGTSAKPPFGSEPQGRRQAAEDSQLAQVESLSAQPAIESKGVNWIAWVFAAWMAGVVTLSIRVAHACWILSRTVRGMSVVSDGKLIEIVRACAEKLHLRRIPRVLMGDAVNTPAVVGLFRPKLLLPAHVLERCDAREIRLIVLHELAHLKRQDIAGNWLIAVATILHWFNPIVWLLAARMRADRELACDELVLAHSLGEAQAYGHTLVKLIEILSPKARPRQMVAIVGILESTTPMQRRVRMIAQFDPKQSRRWIWTVGVLAVLSAVALTDAVRGQDKSKPGATAASPAGQPAFFDAINGGQDDASAKAKLQMRVGDLELNAIPLNEVVDQLRAKSDANLVVEWRTLEAAGIDRATPVAMRLKNVNLKQALELILKDVGGGSVQLGYTIANGAVVVSTSEDLSRHTKTVAYDARNLIAQADPSLQRHNVVEHLVSVIQDMVNPESWRENGGTVGSIRELNGKLIIQQTAAAHEKVADLLRLMESEKPAVAGLPGAPGQAGRMAVGPATFAAGFDGGMPMPGAFAPAQQSPQLSVPKTVVADEEIEAANQQALALLKKRLPEVKFDGIAMSDAIEFCRDTSGANILVNWFMLEAEGIDESAPLSIQLRDVTLETVLAAMMKAIGGQKVALVIDRGVITITTTNDTPAYLLTKTYNVEDLAGNDSDMSSLVNVVSRLAQTQETYADVQPMSQTLVITAPQMSHEQVVKLLKNLRTNRPTTRPAAKQAPGVEGF